MLTRRFVVAVAFVLTGAALAEAAEPSAVESHDWRTLEPGLELGVFAATKPSDMGDSLVRVVRIDPALFELRLLNASAPDEGAPLAAKDWARRYGLAAAINASMFRTDHRTSVGLMRTRSHTNNNRLSEDKAVLAFDRLDKNLPPIQIIDRASQDFAALRPRYGTLVQSIRMVSLDGRNVWTQQPRKWSTVAIAIDRSGKALFIHARSPNSVHDLVDILLELPLGIRNAMYVEGGPEAQLYVRGEDKEHEFVGSFETGFWEKDDNVMAFPVPNVVGAARVGANR